MQEYIVELSKYCIAILMAIYVFTCFLSISIKGRVQSIIYGFQIFLILLMQVICYLDISIVNNDIQYLFFYAFVQLFIIATIMIVTLIYEKVNRLLLNNMCLLLGTGLCILSRLSLSQARRQYIIVMLSLIISLFVPYLLSHIKVLRKLTWFYAAVGISMLSVVLILGEVTHGSKISFSIGNITFQPSEFVKIIFIFFLAAALWENVSFKRVAFTTLLAALHVLVLVISKDLGSALIFFVGFVFILFVATKNYLYFLICSLSGVVSAYIAYLTFSHVRTRVLAWADPWSYIDAEGYQITQSLFALGSGSWFGMGLMKGNPSAIPYVEADFIFSAICEEFGVIFGICLLLVCLNCFIIIMQTALKIHDRFYQLIVYGIGIMYIFQIFLTIGGGTKFIPLTGVTLPFVSYGGSSVMTTMIMFFIIQGIYIRLQEEGERRNVKSDRY